MWILSVKRLVSDSVRPQIVWFISEWSKNRQNDSDSVRLQTVSDWVDSGACKLRKLIIDSHDPVLVRLLVLVIYCMLKVEGRRNEIGHSDEEIQENSAVKEQKRYSTLELQIKGSL
ncbi:hypothetical protein QVD17_08788 [Tagetes erecta]|uniref:Uncharacterized protein n=1 Tax=Tagetes erecta TaxID=13708 RepID=A0AAD8P4E5_TARER|nr:hypothetical protein QVD17_08788 [Tagetes erecta]